ncbi:hypothetical protein [Denitrobaculum tricleocarpae]|uniref:Uncharacterized protein n=1 Tax=Denitrobaculum tricleocarpae TaxID=2591009 RepID=A0A545U135_9PROT|nr:hypothetical protein [Denitrobaculum tricleocarpae]TQV83187.1 hypothetical protein FKG95_00880 [Denitrobaculum tricleocarpae]
MTDSGSETLELRDNAACRRYFAKFERIVGNLRAVAALDRPDDAESFGALQLDVIEGYLKALSNSFEALSTKYLLTGTLGKAVSSALEIDRTDSGFPVFRELLQMANDLSQVDHHLGSLPSRDVLKQEMVQHILQKREKPRDLQYAMSQRVYYEMLRDRNLFLAQNHPQLVWLGKDKPVDTSKRRRYFVHWAVYDSSQNLPVLYQMMMEDSSDRALSTDEFRWPKVQTHLLAQSLSDLKLLTIARGFDKDFPDLHPKFLRRVHVGPMYSHTFTRQQGPLREILAEASGAPGLDWTMSWSVETLLSKKTEQKAAGIFGKVETEVFHIDPYDTASQEAGVTHLERSIILPHRPYQVLIDKDFSSLRNVRKYVVAADGSVMTGA